MIRPLKALSILAAFSLGLIILVLAVVGARHWYSAATFDEEAVRRAYIIELSEAEQKREGVDCRKLKDRLTGFLNDTIKVLVESGTAAKGQIHGLQDAKRQTDAIFFCARLYEIGKNGELNGLQNVRFANRVLEDFIRIDTIVRFTLTSSKCDDKCRSSAMADVSEARESAIAKMK